jgi:ribulose-5-phosphate 4-epimerase/fuculose-1-phosphate aldolase
MVLSRLIKKRVEEYHGNYDEWPKVIVMQNHGFIAAGRTPRDVQTITSMFVKTARILAATYAMGGPNFLTDENVRRIHTRPDEHYRQKQIARK